jgi:Pvc16 N-terminal domain
MSNSLAIATVTATLRSILNDAASAAVSGGTASYVRPDSPKLASPGVNIFLYQATPNPTLRNNDLPTRRADGSLITRPCAALDLHYLITFQGDDDCLVPQKLLGAAAIALHARPVLDRALIATVVQHETLGGTTSILAGSNLADQVELVRVTPATLSLEELSKLWMTFPEVDYLLSAVYVASVVLIETSDPPPGPAKPVLRPCITAVPFSLASIDSVSPQPVDVSVSPPTAITLNGSNLDPTDQVSFNTPGVTGPLIGTVSPGTGGDELVVLLPPGLHAGVNTVRLTRFSSGTLSPPQSSPPCPSLVVTETNAAAFVIRPTIVNLLPGSPPGEFAAVLSPSVGPGQQVFLLLNNLAGAPPLAYSVPADDHPTETSTVTFNVSGVLGVSSPPVTYLARVRVDNAESALTVNASNQFSGPTLTI